MKVVIDDKIPYIRDVLEPFVDVVYLPGNKISREHLLDAEALIIRTRTKCNAQLLDGTAVQFIATATIGFDHIDAAYCAQKRITWTNAPGCNSGSVYQYIAASVLQWAKDRNITLNDRVMGVIGVGNVGSKIVRLAEQLGMRVVLNDPPRERESGACGFLSLNGLLREADIISIHVPLNMSGIDKTYHMVDDSFIRRLNPGSLLINSSRGEVVDERSLLKGKKSGNPADYILDVWENEPFTDDEVRNLAYIATPHIAGYSADGKANGTMMSVRSLSQFFNLGLNDWEPDTVPEPEESLLQIDCKDKSFQEIVAELVIKTYPVLRDHYALVQNPDSFEQLRGEYPLRREFHAYRVQAVDMPDEYRRQLMKMGFKVA